MKWLRKIFDKVSEASSALSAKMQVWSQGSKLSRIYVEGGYAYGQRAKGAAVTPDRETPLYERDTQSCSQ